MLRGRQDCCHEDATSETARRSPLNSRGYERSEHSRIARRKGNRLWKSRPSLQLGHSSRVLSLPSPFSEGTSHPLRASRFGMCRCERLSLRRHAATLAATMTVPACGNSRSLPRECAFPQAGTRVPCGGNGRCAMHESSMRHAMLPSRACSKHTLRPFKARLSPVQSTLPTYSKHNSRPLKWSASGGQIANAFWPWML